MSLLFLLSTSYCYQMRSYGEKEKLELWCLSVQTVRRALFLIVLSLLRGTGLIQFCDRECSGAPKVYPDLSLFLYLLSLVLFIISISNFGHSLHRERFFFFVICLFFLSFSFLSIVKNLGAFIIAT